MMDDPKDPFVLTRAKIFAYGCGVVAVLSVLAWFYIPDAPRDMARSAPLQGPGSQSAALEGSSSNETESGAGAPGPAASGAEAPGPAAVRTAEREPAALYERYCTQCHGSDGLGNTMMARMMEGAVPNLVQGPFAVERSVEAIAALVKQGSANKRMPGFERELGDEGANALAAFVLAFPETKKSSEDAR